MRKGIVILRQKTKDTVLFMGVAKGSLKEFYRNKKDEDVFIKCEDVSFSSERHLNSDMVNGWLFEDILREKKLFEAAKIMESN